MIRLKPVSNIRSTPQHPWSHPAASDSAYSTYPPQQEHAPTCHSTPRHLSNPEQHMRHPHIRRQSIGAAVLASMPHMVKNVVVASQSRAPAGRSTATTTAPTDDTAVSNKSIPCTQQHLTTSINGSMDDFTVSYLLGSNLR